MQIAWGASRMVLLTKRWAFKFPRPTEWRLFLTGLLANMQERAFAGAGWPELCPVVWSVPGGWLVVMRRAVPLSASQWEGFDAKAFCVRPDYCVPAEAKWSSFGWLDGKVVAVDYG